MYPGTFEVLCAHRVFCGNLHQIAKGIVMKRDHGNRKFANKATVLMFHPVL